MTRKKSKILGIIALLTGTFLLLPCFLFLLIHTEFGKEKIVGAINSSLAEKSDIRIRVSGLSGIIPFHMEMDNLALSDSSGTWLEINDLSIRSSPFELFKKRLFIGELIIDTMNLERLPQRENSIDNRQEGFSWPVFLYQIGLKKLAIREASLEEEILGEPAKFNILASIMGSLSNYTSDINIKIERTDGIIDMVSLKASLKGKVPFLTIDAIVEEAGNGLAGRLIGTNGPVDIRMAGSGPANDWTGKLKARIEGIAGLDSEIGIRIQKDIQIRANGSIEPAPGFVPENITPWISPDVNFIIKTRLITDMTLAMDTLNLKTKKAVLDFSGVLDLKNISPKGRFTLNLGDLSPIERLIDKSCAGTLVLEGDLGGTIFKPISDFAFRLEDLEMDNLRAGEASGNLHVEIENILDLSSSSFNVRGGGHIRGFSLMTGFQHFSETKLLWDLDLEGALDDIIRITKLETSANDLSLKISGNLNYQEKTANLEGVLGLERLERLSRFVEYEFPGSASLNLKIDADGARHSLNADMSGIVHLFHNEDLPFVTFIGPDIKYAGSIQLNEKSRLKFSNLSIHSDKTTLEGSGFYDFSKREIDAYIDLDIPGIDMFSSILKQDVAGAAQIHMRLSGDPKNIKIKGDAEIKDPSISDISFNSFLASVDIEGLPEKNKGNVSVSIERPDYKIIVMSDYSMDWPILAFNKILLNGPVTRLDGDLNIDMSKSLAEGELRLECPDLSVPAGLFGENIKGSTAVKATIKSGVIDNRLDLEINGKDLAGRFGRLSSLGAIIKITDLLRFRELETEFSMADFEKEGISMDTIEFRSRGNVRHADFTLKGSGLVGEELGLETSGDFTLLDDENILRINLLNGKYGSIPFELMRPFILRHSPKEIHLENILLGLGNGSLECFGDLSDDAIMLSLNIRKLPIDLISVTGLPRLKGQADAVLIATGRPDRPDVNLVLDIDELKLPVFHGEDLPVLTLMIQSSLKSERFNADFSMKDITGNPFKANLEFPMKLSLKPFSFEVPEKGTLKGLMEGDIILENIASIAGLDDQVLKGEIGVVFEIDGNISAPIIKGTALMQKGEYEHLSIGTVLKDIDMEIVSNSSRIDIQRLNAHDGAGGILSGLGWLDLIPEKDFPFNMEITFNGVTLLNNDTVSAKVKGISSISGSFITQDLKGELTVEKAEFNIPEQLSTEITDIEVIELNRPGPLPLMEQNIASRKFSMNLDLSVISTGRIFVNGRGLSSEWKGDLLIKGGTSEPLVTGNLSILRGSYNFLGKRFNLSKGTITFGGEYPPLPSFDMTGEAMSKDITAIVDLAGTAQDLDLYLSSEPLLPQDEILSRLLFGRSVAQVTPLQAVQLGNAVNSLRGGSGFDLMGRARRFLGFDQLEIKQAGDNMYESTISAGKYLSDNVYLEVERGIGAESGKASVKWELNPNISVETEVGENAETGAGINWKWDY